VDVTPRVHGDADDGDVEAPRKPRRKRSPAAYFLLLLVVVGVGFIALQFLNNATLYYRNADEAVSQKDSLGTKRFRVQGVVQDDVTQVGAGEVDFTISFNNVSVRVHHQGDPPDLFKPGIPVVLEGHWQGDFYASDRILIKHEETYIEQHPDRLSNASE
jgi:cytochrome c-type biogenesis protein CcmE